MNHLEMGKMVYLLSNETNLVTFRVSVLSAFAGMVENHRFHPIATWAFYENLPAEAFLLYKVPEYAGLG